jgi:hypothetical protein
MPEDLKSSAKPLCEISNFPTQHLTFLQQGEDTDFLGCSCFSLLPFVSNESTASPSTAKRPEKNRKTWSECVIRNVGGHNPINSYHVSEHKLLAISLLMKTQKTLQISVLIQSCLLQRKACWDTKQLCDVPKLTVQFMHASFHYFL